MAESAKRTGPVYYGWIMVAICMFTLMLTVGTTVNAFALYVVPVSEEFGLSRATMNTGMILLSAGSAISALTLGPLLDRYSIRLIMGLSGLTLAACLIAFGLSQNILLSAILISLPVGAAMKGMGMLTAPALVARWFVIHRGKAMAITMMGMSLGTVFIVPFIAWLIETVGWRHSLIVLGGVVGTVMIAILPFVRGVPGADDHETSQSDDQMQRRKPSTLDADAKPWSAVGLFRTSRFWAVAAAIALAMAVFQGVLVSLVPIALDLGFSTTLAASLMSAMGISGIAGKFGVAWIADRFARPLILAILFAGIATANAMLLFADSYASLIVSCGLLGLAAGGTMPVFLALLADQFGANSLGTANGNATFVIALTSAVNIRISGEVFDRTGDYDVMFYANIVAAVLAVFLILTIRTMPKFSAQKPKSSTEPVEVA